MQKLCQRCTVLDRNGQDIEDRVQSCEICAKHQNVNAKEPPIIPEIPDRPWWKIAADFFEYHSQHYLLVVDYFSKLPEVLNWTIKQARTPLNI